MSVNTLYTTQAIATGGRDGRTRTQDGAVDHALSTPKELGGAGGNGANPEQLFAAGYAACFLSALKLVAGKQGVTLSEDASITATVGIGPNDAGGFGLTVALKAALPGVDANTAKSLVETAHQVCPYSNATRNNIDVELSVA